MLNWGTEVFLKILLVSLAVPPILEGKDDPGIRAPTLVGPAQFPVLSQASCELG